MNETHIRGAMPERSGAAGVVNQRIINKDYEGRDRVSGHDEMIKKQHTIAIR